jgi:outer membrane receptor protein involved in Fe transport
MKGRSSATSLPHRPIAVRARAGKEWDAPHARERVPAGTPVVVLLGNKHFTSEKMQAFELGERWQAAANLSIDLAAFYNRYRDLASLEFGTPFVDSNSGQTVIPIVNRNLTEGHSDGVETLVTYSPALLGPSIRVSFARLWDPQR